MMAKSILRDTASLQRIMPPPSLGMFRRSCSPVRRIAVLGDLSECQQVIAASSGMSGAYRLVGIFAPVPDTVEALAEDAHGQSIEEVLIVPRGLQDEALAAAVERLAACPVDISVDLGVLRHAAADLITSQVNQDPLPRVMLVRQPMRGWEAWLKRLMDIALSALLLVVLAPLLGLVALAIRIESRGPVIFRQTRTGLNQSEFQVWKFRTMRSDAKRERSGPCQATRDDPRVTRIGRFLRRSSIDELPQLVNVLRGEMSLVGPRPHPVPLDRRFAPELRLYAARHRVLPGITGLAQINGCRGETDSQEKMAARLRYDLEYIRAWSLWLDLKIIMATLCGRFLHANAY